MPMPIEAAEAVRHAIMPNNDVDQMDYDKDIHSNGERLENSVNLTRQTQHIVSSTYYKKAFNKVDNDGMLWDIPPTLIKKTKAPMQLSWLDFFQFRIFNWIPEAIIDKDWRPLCPNSRNGHTNPPLLVFDLCNNYWLNSPNKYVCQTCEDFTNSCNNEEDKRKFNLTSTSSKILQQIGASYPELMDMFPCETSHKNTIDKKLMNLIIHSAVKGVGPSAFRDNIISFHQLEWQKRENQWAQYVLKYLNQPFVFGAVHRNDIVKCPEYFSLQLGGCVPSAKWLLQMFCFTLRKVD